MTIAELYVNLGVKGTDKAKQAVTGVKENLTEVASSGIAAKVAILGMLYAFERLTSATAKEGQGLQQFINLTGLSADSLQRWQYMARQSGVSAEEMAGNIKNVQGAMTDLLMHKGSPEYMNAVGLDPKRLRDTFYVMEKLRDFAQKNANNPDFANKILKSFGLSEGVNQMLMTNKLDLSKVPRNQLYADSEIGQLNKVAIAWDNLWAKVKRGMGHLNAAHGLTLVKDISKVTDQVMSLIAALTKLADQVKVFDIISSVFQGWAELIGLVSEGVSSIFPKGSSDKANPGQKSETYKDQLMKFLDRASDNYLERALPKWDAGLPPPPRASNPQPHHTSNVTVTNHGVKDAHEMKDHHFKKVIKDTYQQYNSRTGGQ